MSVINTRKKKRIGLFENRYWSWTLKGLFGISFLGILYFQLVNNDSLSLGELWYIFVEQLAKASPVWLVMTVCFMFINWGLETIKWLFLLRPLETVPLKKATKGILAGLTISLFTPNRVGEYAGRVMVVQKGKRIYAIFATLMGSLSQWIVLWIGGVVAYLLGGIPIDLHPIYLILAVFLGGLLVLMYWNMAVVVRVFARFSWTRKWGNRLIESVFRHYHSSELFLVLGLSLLRYLTYSLQYVFLLWFFGVEFTLLQHLSSVGVIFLLQTGLPIPPSTGLVVRGNLALWVFGFWVGIETYNLSILAATFSLWIINVLFPALLGALVLLRMRFTKQKRGRNSKRF